MFYQDTHKIIYKKKKISVHIIKMTEKNIVFFENDDKSYTMVDL